MKGSEGVAFPTGRLRSCLGYHIRL